MLVEEPDLPKTFNKSIARFKCAYFVQKISNVLI